MGVQKYAAILAGCATLVVGKTLNDIEKGFASLYGSSDVKTRITAYVLSADLHSESLVKNLRSLAIGKKGVELTAVLYALQLMDGNDSTKTAFIHSISEDSVYLRDLLAADAGEGSYFRGPPRLRITELLGSLAVQNEEAMRKLTRLNSEADGWMGESAFGILEDARKQKLVIELNHFPNEKGAINVDIRRRLSLCAKWTAMESPKWNLRCGQT